VGKGRLTQGIPFDIKIELYLSNVILNFSPYYLIRMLSTLTDEHHVQTHVRKRAES